MSTMENARAGRGGGPVPPSGYLPIEEHGIVGDLRTVALVGTDGTVDWYCPARFDAPSLFGALLDARKGGYFSLSARTTQRPKQLYLPDTNILLPRFHGAEAVGEVIDFMVPDTSGSGKARDLLVRQARAVRGRATVELACHPAFDYGRAPHADQGVAGRRGGVEAPGPAEDRGIRRGRHVHPGRGRVRGHPAGVARRGPAAGSGGDRRLVHADLGLLAELGQPIPLPRPLARDRAAVRAGAQAARLPPHRRAGRRAHHVAAGGTGRRPELGLPLQLAAGCRVHRVRADDPRFAGGGGGAHGVG